MCDHRRLIATALGLTSASPADDGVTVADGGGLHACEILLGVMASSAKNGEFVGLPLGPGDRDVAAKWA